MTETEDIEVTNRQDDLSGMEGPGVGKPSIPEIDKAAEAYCAARDKRLMASGKEVEAKQKLAGILKAHAEEIGRAPDGGIRYEFDGRLVELVPTDEKLRVKDIKDEDEE